MLHQQLSMFTLDKTWSFPLRISSVNVTKSAVSIPSEIMFVTWKKKKEKDGRLNWGPSLFREWIKNKFSLIPCGTMSPFMSNSSKLDFASCIIVNLPEGQRDILRNQFILWLRIYDRISRFWGSDWSRTKCDLNMP